jgi:hypothetical protein
MQRIVRRGGELLHTVIRNKGHAESDIVHDSILLYVKSESFTWKPQYIPFSDEQIDRQ